MQKEIFLSNRWWIYCVVRPIHEMIVRAYTPDFHTDPELAIAMYNWKNPR